MIMSAMITMDADYDDVEWYVLGLQLSNRYNSQMPVIPGAESLCWLLQYV